MFALTKRRFLLLGTNNFAPPFLKKYFFGPWCSIHQRLEVNYLKSLLSCPTNALKYPKYPVELSRTLNPYAFRNPKHQQPSSYNQFNPQLGQLNRHKQEHNKATKTPNTNPSPLPISATIQEKKVNNWIKPAIIEVREPNEIRKTYRIGIWQALEKLGQKKAKWRGAWVRRQHHRWRSIERERVFSPLPLSCFILRAAAARKKREDGKVQESGCSAMPVGRKELQRGQLWCTRTLSFVTSNQNQLACYFLLYNFWENCSYHQWL